ncbi:MAG TPA: hypothetical protein VM618_09685 [Acidimicrobiia bacterium]|nr:hypothetical protein [Acidimicrobiia bacterium]
MRALPRLTFAALVLVLAAALAGCDDGGGDGNGDARDGATATNAVTGDDGDGSTTTAPEATVVEIEVRGGEVVGGSQRVDVETGETVRLEVRSDVEDEVHVHGYDHLASVAPGRVAVIEFDATIPGVFEVELEQRHLALAELRVQ